MEASGRPHNPVYKSFRINRGSCSATFFRGLTDCGIKPGSDFQKHLTGYLTGLDRALLAAAKPLIPDAERGASCQTVADSPTMASEWERKICF